MDTDATLAATAALLTATPWYTHSSCLPLLRLVIAQRGGLLVNSDGSTDADGQAGSLPSGFANDGAMP
jgi:hypothetical protein